MVKIYVRSIIAGKITIKDIPDYWKEQVKVILDKKLENNEITQENYNNYIK